MIRLAQVSFAHDGSARPVLDGVDLTVSPGEVVVVTGASGSGKTTLTRIVNGLIPHLHPGRLTGRVEVGGVQPSARPLHESARRVGSVFQNPRTQFFATEVLSELAFAAENAGLAPQTILDRVESTIDRFELGAIADRGVFALSGGQRQLLACASVDVLDPPVLVLDEPSANLDDDATRRLAAVVADWKAQGRAVLIAEHRVGWLLDVADRILVMSDGRIRAEYTPTGIRALDETQRAHWGLRDPRAGRIADLPPGPLHPRPDDPRALTLTNVDIRHRRGSEPALQLDRGDLPRGEVVAITGPNGVGKSSLARFLVGLGGTGVVETDGVRLSARTRRARSALVMQDVGHQLFAESVFAEVMLAQRAPDLRGAVHVLRSVGLAEQIRRHPLSLSAGQQQRVAVAAAIGGDRRTIVLDEPTSGLDRSGMSAVATVTNRLRDQGRDVFVITHDREFAELAATWHIAIDPDGEMNGDARAGEGIAFAGRPTTEEDR